MGIPDRSAALAGGGDDYKVTLTLSVRNRELLWRMAASRALAQDGLDQNDIEEMFGPVEDPQIGDCLTMLLAPQPVAGCAFKSLTVEQAVRPVRRANAYSGARLPRESDAPFPLAIKI